ncbi:hypothetical protein [Streptomyces sp. NBC_01006]|uniref:hypothetical protein n=1 Tax=Streptomyces sp. NBC_01006 TaxID=2903716 RepID=UPI003866466A|nr:hypothetical protein OG509_12080 [Streptomyces sp. NBC_01006]
MRIRSAVTASALAAGILLGGAGGALADGVDIDYFSGGHAARTSNCNTFAAVPHNLPAFAGPVYNSSCEKTGEKDWLTAHHLGA